jgi:methyltransferase family protein
MKRIEQVLGFLGIAAALAVVLTAPAAQAQDGRGDVVYVPTPQIVVDEMLRMAKIGASDFLIDLGSGDGRIVITAAKKYGARGFGVDLDTVLLKRASENARKEGVSDRANFVEQNLFETDLTQATVISSYLLPEMNQKLRPKLFALKPGTRLVAHDYAMGEWDPDQEKTLVVPEKVVGDPGKSYVYLWIIPANAAGRWESQIPVAGKPVTYQFNFEQNFQLVHGTVRAADRDVKLPQIRLSGENIAFKLDLPVGGKPVAHQFRGKISGGTIDGNVTFNDGTGQHTVPWKAKQTQRGELKLGSAGTLGSAGAE